MESNLRFLAGYDPKGMVFDAGELILRKISDDDYFAEVEKIYNEYQKLHLSQQGIVETEIDRADRSLRHKKYIISYPYEWTANMFKDAIVFYLGLFLKLDGHGFTLKDALPSNIVFDGTRPVFVDFLSIVHKDKLQEEKWLLEGANYSDPRFAVVDKMLIPYIIIPFVAMVKREYSLTRKLLSEKACNCSNSAPAFRDLCVKSNVSFKNRVKNVVKTMFLFRKNVERDINDILKSRNNLGFIEYIENLLTFVANVDVTPPKSAYVTYYEDKNEDFAIDSPSKWTDKPKNVYRILNNAQPRRILDIGANTGWFSALAEKMGAEVVATDVDESSIDALYMRVRAKKARILPLLIPFDNFTKEIYGMAFENDPVYRGRDFSNRPLFLPATERLNADLVLCLGLLHHLILGEGRDLGKIWEILSALSKKALILEYVDLSDRLIQNEPSFFNHLNNYTPNNYNISVIIETGRKYFKEVEILDSYPETRKLLVFEK